MRGSRWPSAPDQGAPGRRRPGHSTRPGLGGLVTIGEPDTLCFGRRGCTRGCRTGPPRTKDAMAADDATPIDSAGPNAGRSPATRRRARPALAIFECERPDDRRPRTAIDAAQAVADGGEQPPPGRRPALGESAWAAHRGSSGDPRRRTGGQPVPHDPGAEACPSCATAPDAIGSTAAWSLGPTTRPSHPSVGHWGLERRKRVYARSRLPTAGRSCQRASAGVDRALREHRQAKAESAEKVRPPGWRSRT